MPKETKKCKTPQAVSKAIEIARNSGKSFSVRSTGHCFAGHSQHSDLVIDTSRLSYIKPVQGFETVEIGAGTWIGTVYRGLEKHDRTVCAGTYDSVGAAGYALGGGLGYYARQHGLLIDHIENFKMVDAIGKLVEASEEQNEDLFWALKGGGGGSFGIVTSFTTRTVPVPKMTTINIVWTTPNQDALRIAYLWQRWSEAGGRQTTTYLQVLRYVHGQFFLQLKGHSFESRSVLMDRLRELLGQDFKFREDHVVEGNLSDAHKMLLDDHHQLAPLKLLVASDMIATEISPDGMLALFKKMLEYPSDTVTLHFEALGGAVRDVSSTATAYPHRSAAYAIYYISDIRLERWEIERTKALAEYRKLISPFTTGGIYVNYPEPGLDNWARRYWGPNLERLVEVKRKWDPDNLFHHAQSVPLEVPK